MRQLKASDFETAHEYEQAKKAQRQHDRSRRQSPQGRRSFEFQPVAPAMGVEE